jgi:hypothetical protein
MLAGKTGVLAQDAVWTRRCGDPRTGQAWEPQSSRRTQATAMTSTRAQRRNPDLLCGRTEAKPMQRLICVQHTNHAWRWSWRSRELSPQMRDDRWPSHVRHQKMQRPSDFANGSLKPSVQEGICFFPRRGSPPESCGSRRFGAARSNLWP